MISSCDFPNPSEPPEPNSHKFYSKKKIDPEFITNKISILKRIDTLQIGNDTKFHDATMNISSFPFYYPWHTHINKR